MTADDPEAWVTGKHPVTLALEPLRVVKALAPAAEPPRVTEVVPTLEPLRAAKAAPTLEPLRTTEATPAPEPLRIEEQGEVRALCLGPTLPPSPTPPCADPNSGSAVSVAGAARLIPWAR